MSTDRPCEIAEAFSPIVLAGIVLTFVNAPDDDVLGLRATAYRLARAIVEIDKFAQHVDRRVDLPYGDPVHINAGQAYWLIRDRLALLHGAERPIFGDKDVLAVPNGTTEDRGAP